MRRQVSLLLAHGHPSARRYPIGMIWEEAALVVDRLNRSEATRAVLLKMAVSAVLSKEAGTQFKETIDRLTEG